MKKSPSQLLWIALTCASAVCTSAVVTTAVVHAQETPAPSDDEAAVRAAGDAYVKAFNASDAVTLASYWSPEAVYTNRQTGEQFVGRKAIAQSFAGLFKSVGKVRLDVEVQSIDFVSPNVAVERGQATFVAADSDPETADYSAVYVRRDGKWLLDRVTDRPVPVTLSHYEQLKPLEWLVGEWVDEDDRSQIVTECKWTKNKNFLTRTFSVSIEDRIELSGLQIIGWDAGEKTIRSWTFDSDGGFAEGVWSNKGDRWYVHKKGTTAGGKPATAVNIVTKVDDGAFKLRSVQRTLDGELLPNIDEVVVVRR